MISRILYKRKTDFTLFVKTINSAKKKIKMKSFVILTLFFVCANAIEPKVIQEFMEKVTKFAGKCMEETKATNEDIAMLMAHQTPSTHEGICMISCMYKAFGVQNADGTMNPDEGINLLGKIKDTDPDLFEKMEAVVNKCRDTPVEEDPCITALNVAKCLMKEGKEMGLSQDILGM